MSSDFDTMQVCLNGHQITATASTGIHNLKFCQDCGAKTITACPSCNVDIRGERLVPYGGFFGSGPGWAPVPKYCHDCGEPYPWHQAQMEELKLLLREFGGTEVAELVDALVSEKATSSRAVLKWRAWILGAADDVAEAANKLLLPLAVEALKKNLFP